MCIVKTLLQLVLKKKSYKQSFIYHEQCYSKETRPTTLIGSKMLHLLNVVFP